MSENARIDTPGLERDAGRDSAHHYAAMAVFGLVGVASVAVTFGWLSLRGSEPIWSESVGFSPAQAAVPIDVPMLRPGLPPTDAGAAQFTLADEPAAAGGRMGTSPPLADGSELSPLTR